MLGKESIPLKAPRGIPEEQANWYRERNLVPSPIVVVTTVDKRGTINAAVKTNLMTVDSITRYAFRCSPEHHTHQNIMATGQFVLNVPTADIANEVFKLAMATVEPPEVGSNEIEEAGLSSMPSEKVQPPRITECVAHYECLLDWCRDEIIVGKTVAVSIDDRVRRPSFNPRFMVVGIGKANSYGIVTGIRK